MSNMTIEEEENFIKESKKHEKHMYGYIHLLYQEIMLGQLEKIEWRLASKICLGSVFKYQISMIVNPNLNLLDSSISKTNEYSKDMNIQSLSEGPPLISENSNLKVQTQFNSVFSPAQEIDDTDILEKEMIEMMDILKYQSPDGVNDKLQSLLDIVSKKMKNSKETSANMQIRVLYQFLLEYKKAKDTPKKEKRTGTRISQVKKTQIKKSQDRIKQNSLESSVYSEKNSPLIPQQKKSIMKTSSFSKRTEEENKSIE